MSPKAGLIALFVKLGPKIFSLFIKLFKGLKLGKVGLAGASIATYSYLLSWQFALMIMILLFVHESGHIWAMKHYGLKTKGIYFIPLLGAAAVSESDFPSRKAETVIALMGPVWGLALSLIVAGIYFFTLNPLFAAAASWMAMVNLFNLMPINPLDGGRVFKSIAFSLHSHVGLIFMTLGIIACLFLTIYASLGLFTLLLVVGALDLFCEWAKIKRKARMDAIDQRREFFEFTQSIDAEPYGLKEGEPPKKILQVQPIQPIEKPKMNCYEIALSSFAFLTLAGVLWGMMYTMKHVPDAAAAMEVFK